MRLAATRRASGRRRIFSLRLPVILLLVAVSALLAVPGAATAHVKAKYRAEYKAALANEKVLFTAYDDHCSSFEAACVDLAKDMAPMIGDPDARETLLDHEAWALTVHDELERSTPSLWASADKSIKQLIAKAPRWFATSADRARFRREAAGMKSAFSTLLQEALPHVSMAFLDLGQDPPELTQAARDTSDGTVDSLDAEGAFAVRLANLTKLL